MEKWIKTEQTNVSDDIFITIIETETFFEKITIHKKQSVRLLLLTGYFDLN